MLDQESLVFAYPVRGHRRAVLFPTRRFRFCGEDWTNPHLEPSGNAAFVSRKAFLVSPSVWSEIRRSFVGVSVRKRGRLLLVNANDAWFTVGSRQLNSLPVGVRFSSETGGASLVAPQTALSRWGRSIEPSWAQRVEAGVGRVAGWRDMNPYETLGVPAFGAFWEGHEMKVGLGTRGLPHIAMSLQDVVIFLHGSDETRWVRSGRRREVGLVRNGRFHVRAVYPSGSGVEFCSIEPGECVGIAWDSTGQTYWAVDGHAVRGGEAYVIGHEAASIVSYFRRAV